MRGNLQATGLSDAIKHETDDYHEDCNVLAAMLRAVPEDMQVGLAQKESAADAWEAIRAVRMSGDKIKEANVDKLRHDFADLQFKPGECVEDFVLRIMAIANQLRALGDKVTEKEEIKKLLHSAPDLEQVAISIEILLDLNLMTIEEATGHLHAVEERKKKTSSQAKDGRLLLTEEEWLVRLKVRDVEGSNNRGHRCGRGGHDDSDGRRRLHGES
jgi:hypothetical protein